MCAGVFYLPLYLEDWVEQVMQRLFTLLQNLDTGPGHRADQLHGKPDLLLRGTHLGKVRDSVRGSMLGNNYVQPALHMQTSDVSVV